MPTSIWIISSYKAFVMLGYLLLVALLTLYTTRVRMTVEMIAVCIFVVVFVVHLILCTRIGWAANYDIWTDKRRKGCSK